MILRRSLRNLEHRGNVLQALLPEDLRPARDAFLYGLVILVLWVRPQGLFVAASAGERI